MIIFSSDSSDVRPREGKLVTEFVVEILIIPMEVKKMMKMMILEIMISWILMKFLCTLTIHPRMKGRPLLFLKYYIQFLLRLYDHMTTKKPKRRRTTTRPVTGLRPPMPLGPKRRRRQKPRKTLDFFTNG